MSEQVTDALLLIACLLGTSVWVGGYVAIGVVAASAASTLEADQRVQFFRKLGRAYLPVGLGALLVAIVSGAGLARHVAWSGLLVSVVAVVAVLLFGLAVAVIQARRMTVLRSRLVASPDDSLLANEVTRGAVAATALRALLGVLSIAAVVLAACVAVETAHR